MKAILEFNLPEDKEDFDFAVRGLDWSTVCWDMDQWLRKQIKYAPDDMTDDELKAFEQCRAQLRELLDEYNLNLEG
jgi:hypothetical protein